MSDKRVYKLVHDTARRLASAQCMIAPDGYVVVIDAPKKSRDQEEKYHAMIGDIARQCKFMGLLVDAFSKVMRDAGTPLHHDGRVVPSLDRERVVQLGVQTREFYKAEASQFVEYLYSYGSESNVVWSERTKQWDDFS
jgi:hypothetical protein